jgi:hypothetical protein
MKCDFEASLLVFTFASLCLGHEPKGKVVTPCSSFKYWYVHFHGETCMREQALTHMIYLNDNYVLVQFHVNCFDHQAKGKSIYIAK